MSGSFPPPTPAKCEKLPPAPSVYRAPATPAPSPRLSRAEEPSATNRRSVIEALVREKEAERSAGARRGFLALALGVALLVLGIGATWWSGGHVIAYGAVVAGALQIFRGAAVVAGALLG